MKSGHYIVNLLAGVLLLIPVTAQGDSPVEKQPLLSPIEAAISEAVQLSLSKMSIQVAGDTDAIRGEVVDFYQALQYRPAWLDQTGPRPELSQLIVALEDSAQHGLIPSDYRVSELRIMEGTVRTHGNQVDISMLAALEVSASSAAVAYIHDLSGGRFHPDQLARHATITVDLEATRADASKVLGEALEKGIQPTFEKLLPAHPQYNRLQKLLTELRTRRGLPKVKTDGLLRKGDRDPALVTVRQILNSKCHQCPRLSEKDESADLMDSTLVKAIKTFQTESAIREDGIIGPNTVKMLNLSTEEQIERVRVNLDRWRWYSGRLARPYILVNVPEYRLRYYRTTYSYPLEMDIIVGKIANATAMFSDVMEYAVLRPYWQVPKSIATGEMLPKIREDVSYFQKKAIEVLRDGQPVHPMSIEWENVDPHEFEFELRQLPGAENALGLVKFMLPNKHAIYLHDTPADKLFEHKRRAFSHGCIRLAEPFVLARELLLPTEIRLTRQSVVHAPWRNRRITLKTPVRVHIAYFTVMVDDLGRARFLNDIYEIDKASHAALTETRRTVERPAKLSATDVQ